MTLKEKRKSNWNPKTDKALTLIFIGAVLATIVLCLLLFFAVKKQSIAWHQRKSERDTAVLARFMERYFTQLLSSQKDFAAKNKTAAVTPKVKRDLGVINAFLKKNFVKAVSLISSDMKLVYTLPESNKIGADLSGQTHHQLLAKNRIPLISSPFTAVQGFRSIAVATPLANDTGQYSGSVAYLVDFDSLLSFFVNNLELSEMTRVYIFDENKSLLYSSSKDLPSYLESILSDEALKSPKGFQSYSSISASGEKTTRFISHSSLVLPTEKKWIVCIDTPKNLMFPQQEVGLVLAYVIPIAFFLLMIGFLAMIRWLFVRRHAAILEKNLAEERESLRDAESRMALMLESLPYIIFELDATGVFTYLRISPCIKDCHESDILDKNILEMLIDESKDSFENAFYHVLTTAHPLHALRVTLTCLPDSYPKTCSLSAFPVSDPDGKVIGVNGIMHDITEHVALEASLIQSQKMEVIGTVTSSVAHDFNNYLATIMGCADLIRLQNPEIENLDILNRALRKAAELTEQLLSFSRKPKNESFSCDLNNSLRQTVKMIKKTKAMSVSIKFDLAPSLPNVSISQAKLDQIVMNIIVNAYDAMPDGGTIVVKTWNMELDEIYAPQLDLPVGNYVILELSDDGPGMDDKTQKRVFEPYYTTKPTGTGLGLATVHTIVKQMNGRIVLKSVLNRGTTFSIYLPVQN